MKKAKVYFENLDLSRYYILSFDEMLRVNGGRSEDSDDGDESDDDDSDDSDDDSDDSDDSDCGSGCCGSDDDSGSESDISAGSDSESGTGENGGREVENTHEAVASAREGDRITRSDGSEHTITSGDIEYERNWCDRHGRSYGKDDVSDDEGSSVSRGSSDRERGDHGSDRHSDSGSEGHSSDEKSGSQRVENTNEAVANAKAGDTIVRNDGSVYTLNEGDIEWAKSHRKEGKKAGSGSNTESKAGIDVEKQSVASSKNENSAFLDTGLFLSESKPKEILERIDSVYCSPFGDKPNIQNTKNQTKIEKDVYAEAVFVDKPGVNSCELSAGLVSVSSKLNNSSVFHSEGNLDIANADFNFGVTEGGLHGGFGLNGIAVSGSVGVDFDKFSLHYGAGVGICTGFDLGVDFSDGFHFAADASFLFGGSIDVRFGGHRD